MRKYLVVAACLGFLLFAGCNRCNMWGWYCPCDLIEGRDCDPAFNCGPQGPCKGQVMKREWAVPADACVPVPPEAMTPAPKAPLAPPAIKDVPVEAPALGAPPAGDGG